MQCKARETRFDHSKQGANYAAGTPSGAQRISPDNCQQTLNIAPAFA
ncbi:MAG: hypothetical protein ABL860_07395 [Candidatus Nitrotoga sp.]